MLEGFAGDAAVLYADNPLISEAKAAVLGGGAKANHLSCLGDAVVGAGANIGAGTITCNCDGTAKHRTEIGEGAFIGSDTALVAPVRVGARPGGCRQRGHGGRPGRCHGAGARAAGEQAGAGREA